MPEAPISRKQEQIHRGGSPSAEELGKKDGQPAPALSNSVVVISAGKTEHEAITNPSFSVATPQLAARHLLSSPANASSDLPSSKVIFDVCRSKRSMTGNGAAQTGTVPDEQPRNGTTENDRLNMAEGDASRMESGSKNTASPPVKADNSAAGTHSSPKKRRKHASTVDDREPSKRARSEHEPSAGEEEGHSNNEFSNVQGMPRNVDVQDAAGQQMLAETTISLPPSSVSAVQHNNIPSSSAQNSIGANSQQLLGYNDWLGGQSQFQDMHTFHPSYMFNAPEVTNEYNLLGDFLSSSLLDDGGIFPNDNLQGIYSDPTLINSMANLDNTALLQQPQPPQPAQSQPPQNEPVQGPSSTVVNDKARETYYMTAADPSGSDPPEERMNKLLKAKYDAGLLKPFNYVKGYARLNQYMEKNMKQSSRQKILRQLDKFRPKFRERMQSLTDIELILVEMWFERSLMEYDRVFASMAIPACCWRRTGEIFRGNKEMAELIGVPIESLRDGKLAIHEIIVEDQLVSYWEKFGAIAFDNTQKAMLTSCTLKNPNSSNPGSGIPCCFSFTIRRDNHNIGNRCDMGTMSSKDPEEHALSVLALATQIQTSLSNASTSEQSLIADTSVGLLDNYSDEIPLFTVAPSSTFRRQLDTEGTKLWNTCTQLMAISADSSELKLMSKGLTSSQCASSATILTIAVKALAFEMLDCATSAHNQGNSRIFELALRAARTYQGLLDLSQKIIGVAATRLNDMSRNQSSHHGAKLETYVTEYYMLRVYLSWLQGRSDIAEHLFSKVPQASRGGHQATVMDICYHVGAQASSRRQLDVAARWLERALSSSELLQEESQQDNKDLKDKKFRVLIAFAWVSLHLDTADAKRRLDRAVVCLKSEYNDSSKAQVLQLEILSKENISDCDEYAESKKNHIPHVCHHSSGLSVLRRAITALELNDADLKTILYFIHKLKVSSPQLFLERIKQLLCDNLAVSDKGAWTERVFISLVWALTESNPCALDSMAVIQDVARSLCEFGRQPLSEEATNACLILVWKHIDTAISKRDISHAERCCEFLLEQPLFKISSDSKGKILRKLISCSRDDLNTLEAHKAIVRHLEECKGSASTLYMLYEFTDLYHEMTGTQDRAFMYLLGEYAKSNRLMTEARGHTPSSAKAYKQIRQSVQRFETHIQAHLDTCNTIHEQEAWIKKHRVLIALDFEAAINLEQWNDLPNIIERASKILDDHLCSVLLDCILRSGASAPNIAQVVKDIICIFHSSPSPSFSAGAFHQKLPRYLRCLFQIALEAKDYSLAESVLHQAIVLARDGSADTDTGTDLPFVYPSDELKWLATMAFNGAVDLYLASADEDCRTWGEIAFTLAGLVKDDGGALLRMLRQNYAKLM
ncbi:hypothetical protein CNMCM5793_006998 [Aspergillus hiratsukae]|uniref:ERT1/acuK family PAS domain-containing protein n=1 Tax=Aspergillus hiratsukae TaxID=1194566 RepID=A0A8H6P505_9EURO|nr:hypothetical protein CNMCM5793_006998 [Aspergillus hiratsukae]KAF7157518.1 hypothetical protein CNMCM6106_003155 [Aspergillus hiratsukae]